jgi:gliding motility-associated-like protein
MIDNVNSKTPLVGPDVSTKYIATLTDVNGCQNTDSIFINVKMAIKVQANNDTTICKGDAITLKTTSDALTFLWSPATSLDDATLKEPVATPLTTTTYHVIANLGKCQDEDVITVKVVPYPAQQKLQDTTVCFPLSTRISVSGGSIYSWSPATFLSATDIPSPSVIAPTQTTQYIATVTDILGCPKPVYDTVVVTVEKLNVDAGPRDTAIVLGEPLYLLASKANIYSWSPSKGLDNSTIQNPIAKITENTQYVLFEQSVAGCKGTDTIDIKVYRVPADLYVPTGFSPNGDGLNDYFRPILLGVRKLNAFYVYNRWGQVVYSSTEVGHNKGWDGTFKGSPQAPGTYVWRAEGISYEGKSLVQKGYVVLIR